MNELIKITENNGQQVVSARELHGFLESKQEFANWIKNRIEEYQFLENEDFVCLTNLSSKGKGGHNKKEYAISLDMAKELSMVEKNDKGKQARRYFIECDKKLKQISTAQLPNAQNQKELNDLIKENIMNEVLKNKKSITSLELVKEINLFRKQEGNKTELQHYNLLNVIRDEFELEISLLKIYESNYKTKRGKKYPMFILTLSQAKQVLLRESKFVRRAIIKHIENLETKLKQISTSTSIESQKKLIDNMLFQDNEINAYHISLYHALFSIWSDSNFQKEIPVKSKELMALSKIGSKSTYFKVLKDLVVKGFVNYLPSFNPLIPTKVVLTKFEYNEKQINNYKPILL